MSSSDHSPNIFLCAGESSGDLYGAKLAEALQVVLPQTRLWGVGGDRMAEAGVGLVRHVRTLSVMGFSEVVFHIPNLLRLKRTLRKDILHHQPSAVILIDFPDFNLRLASDVVHRCRTNRPKIFYYVTPQVWIWRKSRIHALGKFCDHVIPIFDFEHELFRREHVRSFFAGHPINDLTLGLKYGQSADENQAGGKTLALFPGSRPQEVKRILPVMLAAARRLKTLATIDRILVSSVSAVDSRVFSEILEPFRDLEPELNANADLILHKASIAIAKSGTVNIQIAFARVPAVIVYRTSFLTFLVARFLLRIRYISILNILAGKEIVPEFVQYRATPRAIADEVHALLQSKERRFEMLEGMDRLVTRLRARDVAQNVAAYIVRHL